jgi:signal transduction histidine kinase
LKQIYFLFIFLFIFFGCSKKKSIYSEQLANDSLVYYIKKVNNESLSDKDRIIATNNAYNIIVTLSNTRINRDTLFSLSYKYYSLKDWRNFDKASSNLIKKSLESNDSINLSKIYRYRAGYYKNTQVYDSAFYYYLKSEKIYSQLNDKLSLATILLNKGIVQSIVNDYLGAELTLSKAYYIFKDSNEKAKLYGTLNQLGLVCNELKEYERAADYHLKALETVREFNLQNEEHQEAVCYNNLGYLYIKQKKYEEASKNFELALLDKTIINDDPELYSSLIDNLAYCRLQINNYQDLPRLFFEALKERKKLDNNTIVVGSYIHLSEYYQKINDNKTAIKYSDEALRIAKQSKIPVNIILALKQASIVDDEKGLKYSEDYIRISDSLQLMERNSKDRFAKLQLETDEIIKENSFLEEKNRNILNYFFASILIFSLLLYMRTQRSKNRYLIMEQAQQKANEDIYRLIISQQDKLEEGKNLEKSRIAKEIHDGILGRLFGLRLNLDGLNYKSEEEAKEERHLYLSELKLIEQDLREISHELSREKTVLVNNFLAILNRLFEEQIKINKAELVTLVDEKIDWNLLSNTTKINLYRIVQESLQNCNKYSKAKKITVAFQKDVKGNLILTIFDDGIGFEVNSKSKGIGLTNIVDRVHESLGTIDIISAKNKGTAITITVPLEFKTIKI